MPPKIEILPDGTKPCSKCGKIFPIEEFGKNKYTATGYSLKCKPCNVADTMKSARKRPEYIKDARRRQKCANYGLTPEECDAEALKQGNVCKICRSSKRNHYGKFDVDHDKSVNIQSLKFRGVLCHPCNAMLGFFEEDILRIERANFYLQGIPLTTGVCAGKFIYSGNDYAEWVAQLKYRYKLTPQEFARMWEAQGGVCLICCRVEKLKTQLSIDHDHSISASKKPRGLLCRSCNLGLGFLRDNPNIGQLAIEYLQHHELKISLFVNYNLTIP